MARRYSRTVSTSAKPSETGWVCMPGQPRECSECGITIRITKDVAWFRRFPTKVTLCGACFGSERAYYEVHG